MRKTTIIQKRGRREWRKKKEQKRCTEQHYNNKSNRISGHGNDNWYSLLLSSFLHVHSSTSVDCCYACEKCCCPRHFPETLRFAFMRWHNKVLLRLTSFMWPIHKPLRCGRLLQTYAIHWPQTTIGCYWKCTYQGAAALVVSLDCWWWTLSCHHLRSHASDCWRWRQLLKILILF